MQDKTECEYCHWQWPNCGVSDNLGSNQPCPKFISASGSMPAPAPAPQPNNLFLELDRISVAHGEMSIRLFDIPNMVKNRIQEIFDDLESEFNPQTTSSRFCKELTLSKIKKLKEKYGVTS